VSRIRGFRVDKERFETHLLELIISGGLKIQNIKILSFEGAIWIILFST